MIPLNKLVPMLYTPDLPGTIAFYTSILGFRCVANDEALGWASLQNGEVELMLSLPTEHIPFRKPEFTGSFYFKTSDVDGIWKKIKDNVKIVYPLETFGYGMREFAVYDNNGYILQFGQPVGE